MNRVQIFSLDTNHLQEVAELYTLWVRQNQPGRMPKFLTYCHIMIIMEEMVSKKQKIIMFSNRGSK